MAVHAPITGAPRGATIIPFPDRPTAPPFDPRNPAHLRAWEAIWAFGRSELRGYRGGAIDAQIEMLDALDGDPDDEEDNEDCCSAHDEMGNTICIFGQGDGYPGEPEDAEDDRAA